jgi:hypothetical protein
MTEIKKNAGRSPRFEFIWQGGAAAPPADRQVSPTNYTL